MGRDQRLRRAGVIRKASAQPDPLEYWRQRAKYYEQVVLAVVEAVGGEVVVRDKDLSMYELSAERIDDATSKILAVLKAQPGGPPEAPAPAVTEAPVEEKKGFVVVDKRRALGPTWVEGEPAPKVVVDEMVFDRAHGINAALPDDAADTVRPYMGIDRGAPEGDRAVSMVVDAQGEFCEGGERGPVCNGAEGPHVHPKGFTGHPIRQEQEGDE